jgi:hypothetical protein
VGVHLHRRLLDEEELRDLAIREAMAKKFKYVALSRRQTCSRVINSPDRLAKHLREIFVVDVPKDPDYAFPIWVAKKHS